MWGAMIIDARRSYGGETASITHTKTTSENK